MNVNNYSYDAAGLKLTEMEEGLRLKAYPDVRGVWTIGYGHTGPDVHPGLVITQPHAEALLAADIAWAATFVNHIVTVPISQGEFDALVDFTFNEGVGNLTRSTLLRDVNAGNKAALRHDFEVYDEAGGKVYPALLKRRDLEADLAGV